MKVSFIGSGNVATHFANACVSSGINVKEICSTSLENAKLLADRCNANAVSSVNILSDDIDLLIISVNDNSLVEIAKAIEKFNCPVIHTSGSTSVDVLKSIHHSYGVLYPLQTFSKSKLVNIKDVPFFIEASSTELQSTLELLISKWGATSQLANSQQRLNLHIAAVFACNFTNHMYSIAEELMKRHQLDFNLLKPLILETAHKIETLSPKEAQTGPAKRKDSKTIEKHLSELGSEKGLFELYKAISEDIAKSQNS